MNPEWVMFRTRFIPSIWPVWTFWAWPVKTVLGVEQGRVVCVWEKGNFTGLREKTAVKKMGEQAVQILMENFDSIGEIRKKGIDAGEKVVKYCQEFAQQAQSASIQDFISFFEKYTELYQKLIQVNMVYWLYSSEILEAEIKKNLEHLDIESVSKVFSIMSLPHGVSYSRREENEFEKIVDLAREKGLNDSRMQEKIKDFSNKYYWFSYEYTGPNIWDKVAIVKRVEEELAKTKETRKHVDVAAMQKECITAFNLSEKVVKFFKIIQMLSLMQDDRKMFNAQSSYYVNQVIMQKLAKKLGVSFEQVRYVDVPLLSEFTKVKDIEKRLKARTELLVITSTDYETKFYEGKDAKIYLDAVGIKLAVDNKEISEVKGQVANPGTYVGKVRVLLTSQVTDFKEGEILVTGMTTPDFIVLIKKAGAIITDEGGITSHAAIISRELNKPCIIGTKIATKWLKNSDLVEVDAEKGIVRKI